MKSSYQEKRRPGLEYLPTHYVKTLFEVLEGKYSKSYIRKVVQGVRDHDEILKAAMTLSSRRQTLFLQLTSKKNSNER